MRCTNITCIFRNMCQLSIDSFVNFHCTGSQLHVDPDLMGAWNALLLGRKHWVIFPYPIPPEVFSKWSPTRNEKKSFFQTILSIFPNFLKVSKAGNEGSIPPHGGFFYGKLVPLWLSWKGFKVNEILLSPLQDFRENRMTATPLGVSSISWPLKSVFRWRYIF